MAFISLKAKEQHLFQREVWVENLSSIRVWWSQLLCSQAGPWLGQREVNLPVHLWGTGRADPAPLQTDTSRVPIFHMALLVLETDGSRNCSCLCTAEICPVSHPPPACVLRSVKIWFPDCFLAGSQPEGVNHSTTVQACPQLITPCQHKVHEAG